MNATPDLAAAMESTVAKLDLLIGQLTELRYSLWKQLQVDKGYLGKDHALSHYGEQARLSSEVAS